MWLQGLLGLWLLPSPLALEPRRLALLPSLLQPRHQQLLALPPVLESQLLVLEPSQRGLEPQWRGLERRRQPLLASELEPLQLELGQLEPL